MYILLSNCIDLSWASKLRSVFGVPLIWDSVPTYSHFRQVQRWRGPWVGQEGLFQQNRRWSSTSRWNICPNLRQSLENIVFYLWVMKSRHAKSPCYCILSFCEKCWFSGVLSIAGTGTEVDSRAPRNLNKSLPTDQLLWLGVCAIRSLPAQSGLCWHPRTLPAQ